MPNFRCTQMDGFGRLLIDAYRQREKVLNRKDRKGRLLELSYTADKIVEIHAMISAHRNQCVVCRMSDYRQRTGQPSGEQANSSSNGY